MSLGWTSTAGTGQRSILGGGSCATLMAWYGVTSPARAGVLSVLCVPLHVSVYGGSLMNLHFLHALFTLGNMVHYFLLVSYLAVPSPVSGCCMRNTEFEFSDDSVVIRAMLGSTVSTCLHQYTTLLV